MKRYDLVQVNACYTTDHEMEPADDGEWVRFDDLHALSTEERLDILPPIKKRLARSFYFDGSTPVTTNGDIAALIDEVERLRAALHGSEAGLQAAAPPAPTAEPLPALDWQPIATAPKDGSEFIGWNGHRVYVLAWEVDHWDVRGGQLQILRLHPATHWLPLPAVYSAPAAPPELVSEGQE